MAPADIPGYEPPGWLRALKPLLCGPATVDNLDYVRRDAYMCGIPLGPVDVLCSHIPPSVPELSYDVVARRPEQSSTALLAAIHRYRPRWSLFGHVHQPLAARMRIGRTECVNVGHFKRTGAPYVLRW